MDEFKAYLRKQGLKATPQRLAVHEAMLEFGHASADMVAGHIEATGKIVTVASVYNILFSLSETGLYARRLSSNNKMYFDVNSSNHMHVYDSVNNTYSDFFDEELMDAIAKKLGKKRIKGYRIDHIDIQIICRPAAKKRLCRTKALHG